jgi:hypothetical protein
MVKHSYNIVIASHNPGMQERIPVHGILLSKPMEEWVGVRKHLRIKQVIEAEGPIHLRRIGNGLSSN